MATVTEPRKDTLTGASSNPSGSYTERAASAAHETVDRLANRAATAEESIRKTASQSAEQIAAKRAQLQHDMEGNLERARLFVNQNPIASAGIAFAAGMLITAMLRRRH